LNRLIDTIKVTELTGKDVVERELALITVRNPKASLQEIKNICDIFHGIVVDINNNTLTIEFTGPPAKINAAINVLIPFGIKEMARSGTVALGRGEQLPRRKLM
jgi:acetolactate synthase-1/3 small subunit